MLYDLILEFSVVALSPQKPGATRLVAAGLFEAALDEIDVEAFDLVIKINAAFDLFRRNGNGQFCFVRLLPCDRTRDPLVK